MSNLDRDIGSDDLKIMDLVKLLQKDKLLIPTFQREFVWEPANIIKLWDSIYRFYPIGSILYWETDSYLHTHRKLGGFVFPHDEDTVRKFKEWKYILDGQQRATSLLISLVGGKGRVKDNEEFDYTLYFDATDASFFFAGELEKRKKTVPEAFLIRVRDVPNWHFNFYKEISSVEGFNEKIEHNLMQLQRIFTDYKVSVIRIRGVDVNEVCEIFERINQEGKKLDPVDIIVARTYRNEDPESGYPGFYLRENLKAFKEILIGSNSRFQNLDELTIIQMFALCLRKQHTKGRNPYGITPKALDNLTTSDFENNWDKCQKTILETIKFLTDQKIHGPGMLPFVYLALPICYYFHENKNPNRDIARQWFWRNAFGLESFSNSSDVYDYCENFFRPLERGEMVEIPPLTISKTRLVQTNYHYRNALSRAVLAFLAKQNPLDFNDPYAVVLDNVYLLLSHAPNLHHIYPQNFLKNVTDLPAGVDQNSLMNICFLRARTNIKIGDKNPLAYFKEFESTRDFDRILESHLIPREFIDKQEFKPEDYREFLFARADWFARRLKDELPDVKVTIVD
ncbi:MAG: DUF262 domain-containing protein [Peptococcaceae bacterium]|nr:DUF262 domain-containing protein [Peptococcaceae bacterium]